MLPLLVVFDGDTLDSTEGNILGEIDPTLVLELPSDCLVLLLGIQWVRRKVTYLEKSTEVESNHWFWKCIQRNDGTLLGEEITDCDMIRLALVWLRVTPQKIAKVPHSVNCLAFLMGIHWIRRKVTYLEK